MIAALRTAGDAESFDAIDATAAATATFGDSVYTNVLMLGFLWQRGALPLDEDAILRAIELNGAAVESNKRAFVLGRRLAATTPERDTPSVAGDPVQPDATRLAELLSSRRALLTDYQNAAYAERFVQFIAAIESLEQQQVGSVRTFSITVATALSRLMTYKDEYEVARLHTSPAFADALQQQFAGNLILRHHFAPPALGERKRLFGPWIRPVLGSLARLKSLRGTWLDPFGHTLERRTERTLIADYRDLVERLARDLTPANHALATRIAALALTPRGFGHVKRRSIEAFRREQDALLRDFWPGYRPAARSDDSTSPVQS
jgi:indolepyruvate ferredoxin oxidoreductase